MIATKKSTTSLSDIETMLLTTSIPCVSVIVSTSRLPAEKAFNHNAVKNALSRAKELLQQHFPDSVETLIQQIQVQLQGIDLASMDEGLGIYVSPQVSKLVTFAFPVKPRVNVGNTFISRELLYSINAVVEYYVLSVSRKYIRLFKGSGQELSEIRNDEFPMLCEDDYEYERPTRALSYASENGKGYEREKSQMKEIRLKEVLRKAERALNGYLNHLTPLVAAGGKKEVADFMQVTHHAKQVIARIAHYENDTELARITSEQVNQYVLLRNKQMLDHLHELIGKKLVVTGTEKVWKAASEGKGLELVLEKDFVLPGNENSEEEYAAAENRVEGIIRKVLEKKGKVIFVDNGQLQDLGGIALRLRYE